MLPSGFCLYQNAHCVARIQECFPYCSLYRKWRDKFLVNANNTWTYAWCCEIIYFYFPTTLQVSNLIFYFCLYILFFTEEQHTIYLLGNFYLCYLVFKIFSNFLNQKVKECKATHTHTHKTQHSLKWTYWKDFKLIKTNVYWLSIILRLTQYWWFIMNINKKYIILSETLLSMD